MKFLIFHILSNQVKNDTKLTIWKISTQGEEMKC